MFFDRFLANRRGVDLTAEERCLLEQAIAEVRTLEPRVTMTEQGQTIHVSTLLVKGLMSRSISDRRGMRQLVAVHVPGEFVDLHAYPMRELDHAIGTLTAVTIALVPHHTLKEILKSRPELTRKLWFSTLVDAAMHRAWLFRVGRLDAAGRVAHFLCEINARLQAVGLSDGRCFVLGLTQADLAEICGLTTVHTNRVIRQLREAGLCMLQTSMVEILDLNGLTRRANFTPDYLYLKTAAPADPGEKQ